MSSSHPNPCPKQILVPFDFSKIAFSALETALTLARSFDASVEIMHARQIPVSSEPIGMGLAALAKHWLDQRDSNQKSLLKTISGFPPSRLRVRNLEGITHEVILREAAKRPSGIVVMGTHGYSGIQKAFYGSIAEAVAHRCAIPVLSVHQRSAPAHIHKILVPLNMTPYADRALRYTLGWAALLRAHVSVLHVTERPDEEAETMDRLEAHLARLLGPDRAHSLKLIVRDGDVGRAIIEEAATAKFDLIALSAHRKSFLEDFVLGSTAERVLRHSPIPVLSLPSVGAAAAAAAG